MDERLKNIESKYNELTVELTKPEVLNDFELLKRSGAKLPTDNYEFVR